MSDARGPTKNIFKFFLRDRSALNNQPHVKKHPAGSAAPSHPPLNGPIPRAMLCNRKQLAFILGRSPWYVTAMRAGGYVFKFGTLTTVAHTLAWMKKHPEFRSQSYKNRGGRSRPRQAAKANPAVP